MSFANKYAKISRAVRTWFIRASQASPRPTPCWAPRVATRTPKRNVPQELLRKVTVPPNKNIFLQASNREQRGGSHCPPPTPRLRFQSFFLLSYRPLLQLPCTHPYCCDCSWYFLCFCYWQCCASYCDDNHDASVPHFPSVSPSCAASVLKS